MKKYFSFFLTVLVVAVFLFIGGKVQADIVLSSPTDGGTVSNTTPTLTWYAAAGNQCYSVIIDYVNSANTAGTSYTVPVSWGLTAGNTYNWEVYQFSGSCAGYPASIGDKIDYSAVWSFTVSSPSCKVRGEGCTAGSCCSGLQCSASYQACYNSSLELQYQAACYDNEECASKNCEGGHCGFGNICQNIVLTYPTNGATVDSPTPTLTWNAAAGVDHYFVNIQYVNTSDAISVAHFTVPVEWGLTPGSTIYWWDVYGYDSNNQLLCKNSDSYRFSVSSPTCTAEGAACTIASADKCCSKECSALSGACYTTSNGQLYSACYDNAECASKNCEGSPTPGHPGSCGFGNSCASNGGACCIYGQICGNGGTTIPGTFADCVSPNFCCSTDAFNQSNCRDATCSPCSNCNGNQAACVAAGCIYCGTTCQSSACTCSWINNGNCNTGGCSGNTPRPQICGPTNCTGGSCTPAGTTRCGADTGCSTGCDHDSTLDSGEKCDCGADGCIPNNSTCAVQKPGSTGGTLKCIGCNFDTSACTGGTGTKKCKDDLGGICCPGACKTGTVIPGAGDCSGTCCLSENCGTCDWDGICVDTCLSTTGKIDPDCAPSCKSACQLCDETKPGECCSGVCENGKCKGGCAPGSFICNPLKICSIEDFINNLINFIFTVGFALAVLMYIVAGFYIVTAGGDAQKVSTGKNIILYTTIGLGIILLARGLVYVIQQIIER